MSFPNHGRVFPPEFGVFWYSSSSQRCWMGLSSEVFPHQTGKTVSLWSCFVQGGGGASSSWNRKETNTNWGQTHFCFSADPLRLLLVVCVQSTNSSSVVFSRTSVGLQLTSCPVADSSQLSDGCTPLNPKVRAAVGLKHKRWLLCTSNPGWVQVQDKKQKTNLKEKNVYIDATFGPTRSSSGKRPCEQKAGFIYRLKSHLRLHITWYIQ